MATLAQSAISAPGRSALQIGLDTVEAGVSLEAMTSFLENAGLELKDVYDIVIPARTLTHRRARRQNLTRDESDKLVRVIRIYDQTVGVFGGREKVLRFLRMPKGRFSERSPLQMLQTEMGGRLVEEMLWQIADGVFV